MDTNIWEKFTEQEAQDVKVRIRFGYGTDNTADAAVLITALGGRALNEDSLENIKTISRGNRYVLTSDSEVVVNNQIVLSDNDIFTKLAEVVLLPKNPSSDTTFTTGAAPGADLSKLIISLSDGIRDLEMHIFKRVADSNATNFALKQPDETTARGESLNLDIITSTFTRESSISMGGYIQSGSCVDENNIALPSGFTEARFALYYNAQDNSIYTDVGRSNLGKTAFIDKDGNTIYRWRIRKLDNVYYDNGVAQNNPFWGFGNSKLTMKIKGEGIADSAYIKITNIDGQSFETDGDGNLKTIYTGKMLLPKETVQAEAGREFTVPDPVSYGVATGEVKHTDYTVKIIDPAGNIVSTSKTFTPTAKGNYIIEYSKDGEEIGRMTLLVASKISAAELVNSFEKVGEHLDWILGMEYADIPGYMQYSGGGLRVTTKNANEGATIDDPFLITQGQEGETGLGVRFVKPVYIGDNSFNSGINYDSLIKLGFPGLDEYMADRGQALQYTVVITDAYNPANKIIVYLSSGNNGTNNVTARAFGTGQKELYLNSSGAAFQQTVWDQGSSVPNTRFDMTSLGPVELCYDNAQNSLYLVSNGNYALIRNFDEEYVYTTSDGSQTKDIAFEGFPSGFVTISIGVNLTNKRHISLRDNTSVVTEAAFTIMGIDGVDFASLDGYFYDWNNALVIDNNLIAGDTLKFETIRQYSMFDGEEQLSGGKITVKLNGQEVLPETDFNPDYIMELSAGTYDILYVGTFVCAGSFTVAASLSIVPPANGLIVVNGREINSQVKLPAKSSNSIVLSADVGYELEKLLVDGTDVTADVYQNTYTYTYTSGNIITIVATFRATVYTITYITGDGATLEGDDYTITYTVEDSTIALPGANKLHFDLEYWRDEKGNIVRSGSFIFTPGGLILTASYIPHNYTITYNLNYENSTNKTATFNILDYTEYSLLTLESKDMRPGNWIFDGWYTSSEGGTLVTSISELRDITVYAHWVEGYLVKFETDGETYIEMLVRPGSTVERPSDPQKTGHTFSHWALGESEYDFSSQVNSDLSIVAVFTPNIYEIIFVVDKVETKKSAVYGTALRDIEGGIPSIPEKPGYDQTAPVWKSGDSVITSETIVYGNMRIVALYIPNTYTVTFDSNGGSPVEELRLRFGEIITAPAAPTKDGYMFEGWYQGELKYEFGSEISSDISLKAKWTPNSHVLTIICSNNEIIKINKKYGETLSDEDLPTLKGYNFKGLYSDSSHTTRFELSTEITDDLTLYAYYEKSKGGCKGEVSGVHLSFIITAIAVSFGILTQNCRKTSSN